MVEINDNSLIISTACSIVFPLVLIAGFYTAGPQSLWLSMKGGGEYFNPVYLSWLLIAVPVGAIFGWWFQERWINKMPHKKRDFNLKNSVSAICHTGLSCLIGYICFYQIIFLLGYFHPLLICALGCTWLFIVVWATIRKSKIHKPIV